MTTWDERAAAACRSDLRITVRGKPAPQGSKRAFAIRGKGGAPTGRVAVIESSHDRVKSWRQAVLDAALAAVTLDARAVPVPRRAPLEGPLEVSMTFVMPRPKGHYGTGRNARLLKPSAPLWPSGTPDLSKLCRATEDALTDAGIWAGDAQVVTYAPLKKIYAFADSSGVVHTPGAVITIREVTR